MPTRPSGPSSQRGRASAADADRPPIPTVPASLEPLLQEFAFKRLDVARHAVTIIERILEHGNPAEVRWMLGVYGVDRVATSSGRVEPGGSHRARSLSGA